MDSKGLVLISGVNGYIAAQTAAAFLKSGFSVRGTVRLKNPATNNLLRALDDYVKAGRFELMEVPDITATGAFDKAVQGTASAKMSYLTRSNHPCRSRRDCTHG